MPLEFVNLNIPSLVQGSGQPLTAAWLCFKLKYGCLAPIAANARVSSRAYYSVRFEFGFFIIASIILFLSPRIKRAIIIFIPEVTNVETEGFCAANLIWVS